MPGKRPKEPPLVFANEAADLLPFSISQNSIQHQSGPQVYPSSKFRVSPDSNALIPRIVPIMPL
jgi:hypothetical protein